MSILSVPIPVERAVTFLPAAGVADQDNSVGQLLGTDVQMEYGTVAVDDEFRFGNTHNIEF